MQRQHTVAPGKLTHVAIRQIKRIVLAHAPGREIPDLGPTRAPVIH